MYITRAHSANECLQSQNVPVLRSPAERRLPQGIYITQSIIRWRIIPWILGRHIRVVEFHGLFESLNVVHIAIEFTVPVQFRMCAQSNAPAFTQYQNAIDRV